MNIKRISTISILALALVAQALPASAATAITLIRFAPSVSASFDAGTVTLTPPVSNSPAKFRVVVENPAIAKADGLVLTLLGVGSTVITYVQDAVPGYSAADRPSHLYVTPGTPKLTGFADESVAMTVNTFSITPPLSPSKGGWEFTSSNKSVLTINGYTATLVDGGDAIITAKQSATSSWLSATISKKVTVTAITPTVTAIPNVSLSVNGISSFELKNPTSNSGGAWSYTSSNPAVIGVAGNKFTALTPGSVMITAKQARFGGYRSYTTTFKIDVVALTPTVTSTGFVATTLTLTNGSKAFTLKTPQSESPGAWEITSSDASVVRVNSVSSSNEISLTGLKVGTATLTAVQAATGNYAASAPISVVVTVRGTPVVAAMPNIERVAGDPSITLVAPTTASNGTWSYVSSNTGVATVAGNVLSIVGAGTTTITATQGVTSLWEPVSTTFEVRVAGITPTLGPVNAISAGLGEKINPSAYPVSNSSGKWNFTSSNSAVVNVVNGELIAVAAGNATITAYQEPLGKYGRSNTLNIPVTVKPLPQVSTIANISLVAGSAAYSIAIPTSSSAGAWIFESSNPAVAAVSGNKITPVSAGSVKVTARQIATATFSEATQSFTVTVAAAPKPVAGASLSGRTLTVIVKNAKSSDVKVTINGVAGKIGANAVKAGNRTVVVALLGKQIYTKTFAVK